MDNSTYIMTGEKRAWRPPEGDSAYATKDGIEIYTAKRSETSVVLSRLGFIEKPSGFLGLRRVWQDRSGISFVIEVSGSDDDWRVQIIQPGLVGDGEETGIDFAQLNWGRQGGANLLRELGLERQYSKAPSL